MIMARFITPSHLKDNVTGFEKIQDLLKNSIYSLSVNACHCIYNNRFSNLNAQEVVYGVKKLADIAFGM